MARAYRKIEIGAVYGAMTVMAKVGRWGGHTRYAVRCVCGNERVVSVANVKQGSRCADCGHTATGASKRTCDGDSHTRLHRIWQKMHARCTSVTAHNYQWYGAKGVRVCEEWQEYLPFKSWALAHGYADSLTIDRLNKQQGYSPSNCQWLTQSENSRKARYEDARYRGPYTPIEMFWGA